MATATERALQSVTRAIVRGVSSRQEPGPVDLSVVRRILVIRFDDRVGNVILTTPLVRALREALPQARIDWLIAARQAHVVDGLGLAKLIPYDKRRLRYGPLAFTYLLWSLRRTQYDVAIDASHFPYSLSAALLARWSGAPVRVGHERPDSAGIFTHPVLTNAAYEVEAKLELLTPLGVPARGHALETALGRSVPVRDWATDAIGRAGLTIAPFAVVNPGARKTDRRFEPEKFGQLVERIAKTTGVRSLIVWGPGEEELARAVVSASRGAGIFAPPTSLDQLAALLRRSALLLTNDTGPMHLGVACGSPVVALFTVDAADRWGHPLPTFRAIPAWPGAPEPLAAAERAAAELSDRSRNLVG